MPNFDRAFEGIILWVTILLIIGCCTYSCSTHCEELLTVPQGTTQMIDGKKHECFDTENYRLITVYVRVLVPDLLEQNETLVLMLQEARNERQGWTSMVQGLEHKVDVLNLALVASNTELEDVKYQLIDYRKQHKRSIVLHYVLHGVAAAGLIILGAAYGVERAHD